MSEIVPPPVASFEGLRLTYGRTRALDGVSLDIPAGRVVGLIGPDGVGKSSLLSLVAGAREMQEGTLRVLDGDMRSAGHRRRVCPRIAYMPQGLGRNLVGFLSAEGEDFLDETECHQAASACRGVARSRSPSCPIMAASTISPGLPASRVVKVNPSVRPSPSRSIRIR